MKAINALFNNVVLHFLLFSLCKRKAIKYHLNNKSWVKSFVDNIESFLMHLESKRLCRVNLLFLRLKVQKSFGDYDITREKLAN